MKENALIQKQFIPLDKSWLIRMGMLDIVHGYPDIISFLKEQASLSDDLKALLRAVEAWQTDEPIDVGESGTLYRFLRFASWKLGKEKKFVLRGSLKERTITNGPAIVNYPIKKLLELDSGTSQWASAAVLLGNEERIDNPPYKLALSYEAVAHWKAARQEGKMWTPRCDETILKQAEAFLRGLRGEKMDFLPKHSEDYCFARAFGFMTPKEGERRWPSLRYHESDRIAEMEKVLRQIQDNLPVDSKDHRVVQAAAMLGKIKKQKVEILYPEAVNKSWPQFWEFLTLFERDGKSF